MNTKVTIAALALTLGIGSAIGANDKLYLSNGGNPFASVKIDNLNEITYTNSADGGFKNIKFGLKDKSAKTFAISKFDKMEYLEGLPENPYSFTVNPHHMCATLNIEGPQNQFYRLSGALTSQLKGYDESVWADVLVNDDIEYLNSVAEYYQYPLSHWEPEEIFLSDLGKLDWFPDDVIDMGQEIAICLYTCRLNGDEVEVTSEPFMQVFTCKEPVDVGTEFEINVDITSTSMTVKVDPIDDPDIYYNIDIFSPEDIATNGLQYLVTMSLLNLEKAIYQYGIYPSWDEALYQGHGEKTKKNLKSGDNWVVFVYGVEYGVTTTGGNYEFVEVPLATVTDNCTFTVNATQKSPAEMSLEITPSNPSTRYVAFLIESEKIAGEPDEFKPEYYVAGQVYYLNYTNNINWATSEYVHSGKSTVSTLDGVINGKIMKAGTEYTVLIFGVTDDGTRTTALHQEKVMTERGDQQGNVTFDITFSDFDDSSEYFRFMNMHIVPSDPEAKYVVDLLKVSNSYASLENGEEEFVQRYVDVQGTYLKLNQGEMDKTLSMNMASTEWEDYAVFVFAYDGALNGPLYYYIVNPETGDVTQVTGPGAEQ